MADENGDCILITASCTTSWFDWIHGELWLSPDGLLRRSLGLIATFRHLLGRTVDPDIRPTRRFTPTDIDRVVHAGRRNRWIPWSAVTRATLVPGVAHTLYLELGDKHREKFMWLPVDGGFDLLEPALSRALAGRFEVIGRPTR
jgi:hypothetical protein